MSETQTVTVTIRVTVESLCGKMLSEEQAKAVVLSMVDRHEFGDGTNYIEGHGGVFVSCDKARIT